MPQRVVVATRNWRIDMIAFIPGKTLGRLMLISAGILLHANGALAAQFVCDPQMQADDLLSGTTGGRAKVVAVSPAGPTYGRHALNPDPQQQARRLILGEPISAAIARQNIRRAYADGQESARRMLLGTEERDAS
jgi:hypothetical protein